MKCRCWVKSGLTHRSKQQFYSITSLMGSKVAGYQDQCCSEHLCVPKTLSDDDFGFAR